MKKETNNFEEFNIQTAILEYIVTDYEYADEETIIEVADELNLPDIKGEVMTIAQRREDIGMEKGLRRGLEQGRQEGVQMLAGKMLGKGMDAHTVAELSGLPLSTVEQLQQQEEVES